MRLEKNEIALLITILLAAKARATNPEERARFTGLIDKLEEEYNDLEFEESLGLKLSFN